MVTYYQLPYRSSLKEPTYLATRAPTPSTSSSSAHVKDSISATITSTFSHQSVINKTFQKVPTEDNLQSDCLGSGTACEIIFDAAIKVGSVRAGFHGHDDEQDKTRHEDTIEHIAREGFDYLEALSLKPDSRVGVGNEGGLGEEIAPALDSKTALVLRKGCALLEGLSLKPVMVLHKSPWTHTGHDIHDLVMTFQITSHMIDMSGKGCILHQYVSFINLLCQEVMGTDCGMLDDAHEYEDILRPVSEIPWTCHQPFNEDQDSSDEHEMDG